MTEARKHGELEGEFQDLQQAKRVVLAHLKRLIQWVEHDDVEICDAACLGFLARSFNQLIEQIPSLPTTSDYWTPATVFDCALSGEGGWVDFDEFLDAA